MKIFAALCTLLAGSLVFAQDQPGGRPGYNFMVWRTAGGYRISVNDDQMVVKSTLMRVEGGDSSRALRLSGGVEVTTKDLVLVADEVEYHVGTGEIEPRGNVRVTIAGQQ